ncbi:GTPase Era [Pleionea sediminis]|uniref:GTPase Era n=1 Tax=Pleionea sediminis TaxID=2569479 RepID=UPI001186BB63|nr:GTPase Era [Pleionea sediminis]
MKDAKKTYCGYVSIIGRPNVGKSTLLNRLLGQKISITSRKPQTTRHRILGIDTVKNTQVVYVDTPGMHVNEARAINRLMNKAASSTVKEVDLNVLVVEGSRWNEDDDLALKFAIDSGVPTILFINKVDNVKDKSDLLPHLESLGKLHNFKEIIPGSAEKGDNVELLKKKLFEFMPEGTFFFPEDYVTDRSQRFMAAEIVREKIMRHSGNEIPYSVTVEIERFEYDDRGIARINALILVERNGQKNIVIGRKGEKLKVIGRDARKELEHLLDCKVYLETWVKVKDGWADDERALRSLGYDES